jgi:serine/threonine protein phosphatase PrpC
MFTTKTYYASVKGMRTNNEDAHKIVDNGTNFFWGIYDGHGGAEVSAYLEKHLSTELLAKTSKTGYTLPHIREIYDKVQKQLIDDTAIKSNDQGSTALTTVLTGNRLQIMNVGDCRIVVCQKDGMAIALSTDHKPEWPKEKKRIEDLGGKVIFDKEDEVYRIQDLSVSRAFGDETYSKYVTHKPEISSHRLKATDQFMILACDGLWDVLNTQEAVNYVLANKDKSNIAKSLANHAIKDKKSADNVTVIVVYFKHKTEKPKKTTKPVALTEPKKKAKPKKKTMKKAKKSPKSKK